jgi:peptide/nickel transport system ATP-binding protein
MNASATSTTEPILKVDKLSVDFWVSGEWYPAAIDLDYEVLPGEVMAVVGESGSGKSSSAMALMGLLPGNSRVSGSIKLSGREVAGLEGAALRRLRGKDVAVIFQEPMTALNPVYTIGFQIVEAIRSQLQVGPAEARSRAIELLGMVEIPDPEVAYSKFPHQLSGGQRQRAMIAMAISCDPLLLIADEPTTALDVTVQAEILDLLRNLRGRLNSAILLITHDLGVVADLADHIVVMKDGRIVERGPIEEIYKRPQHPYTQQLLAAIPHLGTAVLNVNETELAATAARQKTEPVLALEGVSIDYPKRGRIPAFRAVEKIDLVIRPGEVLGLVGESGSGKTTVGRAAVGLLPVAEGSLKILGQDISKVSSKELRAIRRQVGIVFQDPGSSLNPRWPIGDSIGEPLLLAQEAKGADLSKRVEKLLDQVELPRSFRNRYPHELSGGQRQRVGIARALALRPSLLVADEPTSALDVSVQSRFLALLQGLQEELQFACLFVSHDLAVVDLLSHRIAVMHRGKIVEIGEAEQICTAPREPYTRSLISAVPNPDPRNKRMLHRTRFIA